MVLIIDASNIISGAALTHLKEFIKHAEPQDYNFNHVVLWASKNTLKQIEDKKWLKKRSHPLLNKKYLHRLIWKYFVLKTTLSNRDVLYIPGTGYMHTKAKVVTMCRNLLPLEKSEMNKYFPSMNKCGTSPNSVSGSLLVKGNNIGIFRDTSHVKYP